MRHADRTTSISGANIDPVAKALIEASVHNKQIRHYQKESEGSHTVSSLQYASTEKRRPNLKRYTNFADEYPNLDIETYLRLLCFDEEKKTLPFQLNSWQRIGESVDEAQQEEDDKGVIISADTGFGKTAAFSGEVLHQVAADDTEPTDAIFVYPSRALLRDQLGTALKRAVKLGTMDGYTQPSLGVWSGDIPFKRYQVLNPEKNDITTLHKSPDRSGNELGIINHWDDSLDDTRFYVGEADTDEYLPYYEQDQTDYRIFTANRETVLSSEDLVLHKGGYRHITQNNDRPQILFTTLESLESIAFKPHYRIVPDADIFVFDEIHQYTGVRGSHAARIINNVQWVRGESEASQSGVFIGASATVAEPQEFGEKLFSIDETDIATVNPTPKDIDSENEDKQHYYFMLTPDGEDDPGVGSQYIQQALLTGQSFLKDPSEGSKSKLLTFIDSTSQVNRLTQQITDAQNKGLPSKHVGIEDGDWEIAAQTARREYESFKNPVSVYAGSGTSPADIQEADVVNSTSFLEIGIDIGDIEFIGQYRSPRNLTDFKQRAGRGGRDKGTDAHIQVFLSGHAGDENFYYRADRFLKGDIHTPLNPNNEVVDWIHDRFRAVYRAISAIVDEYENKWYKERYEKNVITNLFSKQLGYDRFWKYLDEPSSIIIELTEITDAPAGKLYTSSERVDEVRDIVEDKKREVVAEIRSKSSLIVEGSASTEDEVPAAATKKVRELRNRLRNFASTATELADEAGKDKSSTIDEIDATLNQVTSASHERQLELLSEANNLLGRLRFELRGELSDTAKSRLYSNDDIDEVEGAVDFLQSGELATERRRRDVLNYILRSLEGIEHYIEVREYGAAHGSLPAIKGLLRSAYFLNKAYQTHEDEYELEVRIGEKYRDDPDETFWYVPDDYFDNAGKYFSLTEAKTNKADEPIISEESVDAVFRKYIPFKAEYLEAGKVQAFCPAVSIDEEGEKQLLLSEEATVEHKGIATPEELSLTEIPDVSDEEADEIYPLHPDTYKPLSATEVDDLGRTPQYGKIMSHADIRTSVKHRSEESMYAVGNLWAGPVDAQVQLRGVEMSITPYEYYGDSNFGYDDDVNIADQYYESDTNFGFLLETTGVTWDISEFLDELFGGEDTHPAVENARSFKSFENVTEDESALVTAAHFLALTIADVTGAGTQLLLYGIDEEKGRVHVFDQTQGGQGIIELFYREMERNPRAALDAVHRLIDNSQVLSDIVWSQNGKEAEQPPWEEILEQIDEDALQLEGDNEARKQQIKQLNGIAESTLGIDYEDSLNRISEELASTIQRLHYFAQKASLDPRRFYQLKHELALARANGAASDEIPSKIVDDFDDVFESEAVEYETLKSLLYPPDMDGCKANLHLSDSIVNVDQSEVLSFSLLTALSEYVLGRIDVDDREKLANQGRHWGRIVGDELEYLSWGDEL